MSPDEVEVEMDFGEDDVDWSQHPRHACCIVVKIVEDRSAFTYRLVVNPDIPWHVGDACVAWAAEVLTRIEDEGFDRARSLDSWSQRSDGLWQMWGRPVELPPLE